jgi:hypothetical protein
MRGILSGALAVAGFAWAGATGGMHSAVGSGPALSPPSPATPLFTAPSSAFLESVREAQQYRQRARPPYHEFYFTRAIYSDFRGGSWSIDYPDADWHFVQVARRLAKVDAYDGPEGNAVWIGDPDLRRYPFLYALEVGSMTLTDAEVDGLRSYLAAGGFLIIDDFWGTEEWNNFEREITRVLPDRPIVELGVDHPIFGSFYNIDEIRQVPGIRNAYNVSAGFGVTYERDGYVPHVRGIFDEDGRLLVAINWNTDLGDAWEHAEDPFYPLEYSTYAFEVAMNLILYGLSR